MRDAHMATDAASFNGGPLEIFEPYHDEEARGVLFQVILDGRSAQGYISCELLMQLEGALASTPPAWVQRYRQHQPMIDAVVARLAPAQNWETVMVVASDLLPA